MKEEFYIDCKKNIADKIGVELSDIKSCPFFEKNQEKIKDSKIRYLYVEVNCRFNCIIIIANEGEISRHVCSSALDVIGFFVRKNIIEQKSIHELPEKFILENSNKVLFNKDLKIDEETNADIKRNILLINEFLSNEYDYSEFIVIDCDLDTK